MPIRKCALVVASGVFRGALMLSLSALGVSGGGIRNSVAAAATDSNRRAEAAREIIIKRDTHGTPHIYAASTRGLFYGYGYASAEDRLFQLEMLKRSATGRVSEVLGPQYLELDRATVSGYDPSSIQRQLEGLTPENRDIFEGLAAGINARINEIGQHRSNLMPKEFGYFHFDPSPWTSLDVAMLWVGSMADRYSDINQELPNAGLLQSLTGTHDAKSAWAIFNQLRWEQDSRAPTTIDSTDAPPIKSPTFAVKSLSDLDWLLVSSAGTQPISSQVLEASNRREMLAQQGVGLDFVPHASNVWLAGRTKTTDGSAVLVNGPQMGNFVPGWMWSVGLHGAGFDTVGNTPVGFPFVQFGSNDQIAWGSTAGLGDTVDLYQEKLKADDPHVYWYDGVWRPMVRRVAFVTVKGRPSVEVEIYTTVHGIVSFFDTAKHRAYARRRAWDGREIDSLLGWVDSTKAHTWDEFKRQAARMAITINWYYADREGNIGYLLTGLYPIRPSTQDFRVPASGTGDMEWGGFYPFSNNPQVYNPTSGFVANWNNRSQFQYNSSDYLYWGSADHVDEITIRLKQTAKMSPDALWAINREISFADANARFFVPLITAAARAFPMDSDEARAANLLRSWNGLAIDPKHAGMYSDSAATIFREWIPTMLNLVLSADVPSEELAQLQHPTLGSPTPGTPTHGTRVLLNALLGAEAGVPQTFDFLHGRNRDEVIREGLSKAVAALRAKNGSDMSQWLTPVLPHVFATENFVGVPETTPDRMRQFSPMQNRGTENDRVILSRSGVERCDVVPPGESGFVSPAGVQSVHADDQLGMYQEFTCKPVWLSAREVDSHTESVRRLKF
jgi:penicillin G amidase